MGRIHARERSTRQTGGPDGPSRGARAAGRRSGVLVGGGLFAAGLAAGLALGAGASVHAPDGPVAPRPALPDVAAAPRVAPVEIAAPTPAAPTPEDEASVSSLFAEWLANAEAARLSAMARKVTGAGLDFVAERVIEGLEDDALAALIASTTDYSASELSEIEDVPGFAKGLARIAMAGTVREAEEPDDGVRAIDFSEEITWDHRAAFTQSQFDAEARRIYAVFESDGLGLSETLAKWTRVADGEILLFKRHRIRAAAASSYVYLDAPPGGFAPGEYRVDFYSADPELRWLASGVHRISR